MPGNFSAAASPTPTSALGAPGVTQFSGSNPAIQGYNAALTNLGQAYNLAGNTTSGQLQGLQQQLGQNQASVTQGLTNAGLANSTTLPNELQAPLQTYNLAAANVQNQGALTQMGALENLANMSANAGNAINAPGVGLPQNQVNEGVTGALPGSNQGAAVTNATTTAPSSSQTQAQAYQNALMAFNNNQGMINNGGNEFGEASMIAGYDDAGNPLDMNGNPIQGADYNQDATNTGD